MDMYDGPNSSYNRGGRSSTRGGYSGRAGYQDGAGYGTGSYGGGNYRGRGRAPEPRGGYSNNFNNSGYRGSSGNYRGQSWGNQSRGRGRAPSSRPHPRYEQPPDVEFRGVLRGHTKLISAIVVDPASSQIFSGSADGSVRMWSPEEKESTGEVRVGGPVDSLLLEGGYLFVGMHTEGTPVKRGLIKVYDLAKNAEHTLEGHQGQVLTLAAANNMLISGGQDGIRVWKFNPVANIFEPQVAITAAQGGHTAAVQALVAIDRFLFSADWDGTLKIWDMESGQCVQTLPKAHSNVIMAMLAWEGHLLTGALDGAVSVWQPMEHPAPGSVLDPTPVYSHPPDDRAPGGKEPGYGGVLALGGSMDTEQRPVLLASHIADEVVRLWQLPDFAERGELTRIKDARAVACGPGGLLIVGDRFGQLKLWRWKPGGAPM